MTKLSDLFWMRRRLITTVCILSAGWLAIPVKPSPKRGRI